MLPEPARKRNCFVRLAGLTRLPGYVIILLPGEGDKYQGMLWKDGNQMLLG